MVALRVFYRWAVAEGRLEVDPSVKLATPKAAPRLPKPRGFYRIRLGKQTQRH